ncbi:MAG: excisionase family DNA-binding protein [Candidatus Paceibacterota bacterium]
MANNITDGLLTVKQVCSILNVSIATIYRWEAEGNLPFPKLKIGPSAVRFRQSDVYQHIENQLA